MPQIVLRPLSDLVLYARNSRTHSPDQVAQIKASIMEFGFTNAILADERGVVAGHGRYAAVAELYAAGHSIRFPNGTEIPAGMVPVVDCTGWSEAQRKAYIIADNKLALNAGWDNDLLRVEMEELQDLGFDMDLLGFTQDEIDLLMDPRVEDSEIDPDEIPDPPAEPFSQPGDMWILGPHRVRCGDSTSVDDWEALMQGELADVVWTDPPYNVAYESELTGSIKNDDMSNDDFNDFLFGVFSSLYTIMKPGCPIYVAHADGGPQGLAFRKQFQQAGLKLSGCLIWKKDSFVLSRMDYQPIHEPILYGWKEGSRHKWFGGRKQHTVISLADSAGFEQQADGSFSFTIGDRVFRIPPEAMVEESPASVVFCEKPKRSPLHPTTKPVALVEKFLTNSGRLKDIAVDAFGGSGTTLIAAERLGMCARLMELDPKFVDVICMRYFAYTGRVPVHALTGEPFPVEARMEERFKTADAKA